MWIEIDPPRLILPNPQLPTLKLHVLPKLIVSLTPTTPLLSLGAILSLPPPPQPPPTTPQTEHSPPSVPTVRDEQGFSRVAHDNSNDYQERVKSFVKGKVRKKRKDQSMINKRLMTTASSSQRKSFHHKPEDMDTMENALDDMLTDSMEQTPKIIKPKLIIPPKVKLAPSKLDASIENLKVQNSNLRKPAEIPSSNITKTNGSRTQNSPSKMGSAVMGPSNSNSSSLYDDDVEMLSYPGLKLTPSKLDGAVSKVRNCEKTPIQKIQNSGKIFRDGCYGKKLIIV